MKLVLTQPDIEPLPKFNYEGILNSNYKEETVHNFFHSNSKSIFGIKQRIKSKLYQSNLGIDVVLKVFVFLIFFSVVLA